MSKKIFKFNKNNFWELESIGLLVPKKHWRKIKPIIKKLWIKTILNLYEDKFLFQFDKTTYIRDTYFLSIAQIAYFDHQLAVLLDYEIFLLEKNLTQVIVTAINHFLNSRIFPNQNIDDDSFNLTIEELLKGNNKKIFLRLFNKLNAIIRKDIFSFLEYVAANKSTINAKSSINKLFLTFSKDRRCSQTKIEITIKMITDILQKLCKDDNLTLMECLLKYSDNIKEFFNVYQEHSIGIFLDKLSKRTSIAKIKKRTLEYAINELSLGDKIDIFDALNEDVKSDIINTFFKQLDVNIGGFEKTSTFIQTLRILQKVRNKCCHIKRIYDYVTNDDNENEKVINFLNSNSVYNINSRNSINLWGIIECICILNGDDCGRNSKIKKKIMKMITKIDFSLLPNSVATIMIKQFKMNEWFDFKANKIKKWIG